MTAILPDDLVQLSARLGDPAHDYVILGEGNTSALADDGTFWVKASGVQLRSVATDPSRAFVRVHLQRALAMLATPDLADRDILSALLAAKADALPEPLPSVETVVHAACLSAAGVRFVGHTHPTAVNALTCSKLFRELASGRLFPDQVVVCGPESVLVAYTDPGLRLAVEVKRGLDQYASRHGTAPKTVYLQNHGLIALGATAREVENITAMAVKSARILLGSLAADGPNFLAAEHVARIHGRADEHYRQRIINSH